MRWVRGLLLLNIASAHAQGWIPDRLDDVRAMASEAPEERGIRPSSIDFSSQLPPPRDQGQTDTCTSWAVTYAAGTMALRKQGKVVTLGPTYTYPRANGGRFCRGSTTIGPTLNVLRDEGALPWDEYRFDAG